MKALRKFSILLAAALCTLGCTAAASPVAAAVTGDVNGDSSFDILDDEAIPPASRCAAVAVLSMMFLMMIAGITRYFVIKRFICSLEI